MPDVYRPDGALLAAGVSAAARLLGVSRRAVYDAAEEAPGGWRLRYLPRPEGGRRPYTPITLWDGRTATGWREAARLAGETQGALKERREPLPGGGWRVRERGTLHYHERPDR